VHFRAFSFMRRNGRSEERIAQFDWQRADACNIRAPQLTEVLRRWRPGAQRFGEKPAPRSKNEDKFL
jgi:hypothetical protein